MWATHFGPNLAGQPGSPGQAVPMEEHLTPVYHSVDGVSQKVLRAMAAQALAVLEDEGVEEIWQESW